MKHPERYSLNNQLLTIIIYYYEFIDLNVITWYYHDVRNGSKNLSLKINKVNIFSCISFFFFYNLFVIITY